MAILDIGFQKKLGPNWNLKNYFQNVKNWIAYYNPSMGIFNRIFEAKNPFANDGNLYEEYGVDRNIKQCFVVEDVVLLLYFWAIKARVLLS